LRHSLHELLGLLRQALRHFLRFFGSESLQLIKKRHLFDFFFRILFHLGALARDFRLVHFRFAFCREIRACAHRQCGSEHARKTGDQNVMLLIVCRTGDARNDSKHCAKPIICAVNCIGDPTAAASVPAFALKDLIQRSARVYRRCHRAQCSRMSFLFDRAFSQKFLNVMLARERMFGLIVKLCFLPFFGRFHAANGNFRSGDLVPPTI
jgi:hypothetical protein